MRYSHQLVDRATFDCATILKHFPVTIILRNRSQMVFYALPFLTRSLIALLVVLSFCESTVSAATKAGDWTLYKIGGRDHVSLDNVADFYGLGPVRRASGDFTIRSEGGGRSLRGKESSQDFYINGLKFILSYPITEYDGKLCISRMDLTKLVEPVMRPGRIKGAELVNTVILDPGHGGHEHGARSAYGHEKTFTLDVGLRARTLLQQAGFRVHMTRSTDEYVSLYERAQFANQFKNAIFISIHFNSGGAGTGLETYTLAPRGVPSMMADGPRVSDLNDCAGNVNDAENIALATATHAALVVKSRMFDRGIKRARFVVIREVTIPGVLIEGGFLSNPSDARLIAMPQYRQQMAQCIMTAVSTYRRAVGAQFLVSKKAGESPATVPQVETPDSTTPAPPAPAPVAPEAATQPAAIEPPAAK